jgi:hypothetical protein
MQTPFKQRPRRRLLKLALTIGAGLVLAYYLVIPTVIALVLIHYRQPICCVTPADRGLTTYEDVRLTTADGLTLVGLVCAFAQRRGDHRPARLGRRPNGDA